MREITLDPNKAHVIIKKPDRVGLSYWLDTGEQNMVIASVGRSLRSDTYSVYLYPHYLPWPKQVHPNGNARSRQGAIAGVERFIHYWFRKSGLKKPTIRFQK